MFRAFARLQTRGQEKPQGVPCIDWTHPLASGLVFYGFDTGSGLIIDLVAQRSMGLVGTKYAGATSALGTGALYGGSGSAFFKSDADIRNTQTVIDGLTFACAYIQTGTVGAYSRPFCRTAQNGTTGIFANWDFSINPGGAGQNQALAEFGGNQIGSTWTGNANNVFTTLMGVSCYATIDGNNSFFAQGQLIGTTVNNTHASDTTNDSIIFSGSSDASAANGFVGQVFYGALWRRRFTAAEAMLLHQDPYSFLIPAEGEMPALFTAGGGGFTPVFRKTLSPLGTRIGARQGWAA